MQLTLECLRITNLSTVKSSSHGFLYSVAQKQKKLTESFSTMEQGFGVESYVGTLLEGYCIKNL